MLFDVKLSGKFWNTINREARHINIVLAAGEIQARFTSKKGASYQTKMVSGMALELPKFDRVEIKSETDQQIKVWVSDVPLAYSPDSTRQVGSNAIRSSVGYVYSGYPHELLPAEIGRNRITLTPSQDIYIGGTNVSPKNGVLLPAGQTFTMATQGAVWALEKTGLYQPYFTALVDPDDAINQFEEGGGSGKQVFYENEARTRAWGWGGSRTSTKLFEYDPRTKEYRENFVTLYNQSSFAPDAQAVTPIGGDRLAVHSSRFCGQFDMSTGDYERYSTSSAPEIGNIMEYVVAGEYHYIADYEGRVYRAPNRTEEWALYADTPPFTNGTKWRVSGFAVFDDGRAVWANENQLFYTIDGAEWVQGVRGDMASSYGLEVDRANDILYSFDDEILRKSYDSGATWHEEFDPAKYGLESRAPQYFRVQNGLIVAVAWTWYAIKDPITGEWAVRSINENNVQRSTYGISISPSGLIHFYFQPNYHTNPSAGLNIQGKRTPVGGLPISIMAEVN